MQRLPISIVFAIALSGATHAAESPNTENTEIWTCRGAYQTAPGEEVKPQERTLTLYLGTPKAVMKVEGTQYQGRFEASGQHVAAWFEIAGAGGERLIEEATLGRVTGRLAAHVERKDGARVGVYRGACRPAGEADPATPNLEGADKH
jgi:hypothetical protein